MGGWISVEIWDGNAPLGPDQAGACAGADAPNPVHNFIAEIDACIAAVGCDPVLAAVSSAPQAPGVQHQTGLQSQLKPVGGNFDAAGSLMGAVAAHLLIDTCCYGSLLCHCWCSGDKRRDKHRDGSLKLNHRTSIRDKLVGGDTPGPAACRQLGVVTVGNFVDQLELAKASGILHRWHADTNLWQLQQKVFFGLRFGIKGSPWLHCENSALSCRDQCGQQQSSRQKSAHSAEESPAKLRSAGSGVNARLSLWLEWLRFAPLTSRHG